MVLPQLPVLGVLALSFVVVGSLALAFSVWRRRHAALAAVPLPPSRARLGKLLGSSTAAIGILIAAGGTAAVLVVPRRGELEVQGVEIVRADPERGVPALVAADACSAGSVLVHFEQPGDRAERQLVANGVGRLEAQRQRLAEEPLDLDAELVRTRQQAASERMALEQRREWLAVERHRLVQQGELDLVAHRIALPAARGELAQLRGQRVEAAARLEYAEQLLTAGSELQDDRIVSSIDVAGRRSERDVLCAQIDRYDAEIAENERRIDELVTGVERLERLLASMNAETERSLACVEQQLTAAVNRSEAADRSHAAEVDRTARARELRVRELDHEIEGLRARLRQIDERSEARAASAGTVVYRCPAPAAAPKGAPLLAVASGSAMVARFRVSEPEARSLAAHGEVSLEIAGSEDPLQPRVVARVAGWNAIAHEPGMAVVRLDCEPSWDVLRNGLEDGRASARLLWLPPFWLDPLVQFGLLIACAGCLLVWWSPRLAAAREAREERKWWSRAV